MKLCLLGALRALRAMRETTPYYLSAQSILPKLEFAKPFGFGKTLDIRLISVIPNPPTFIRISLNQKYIFAKKAGLNEEDVSFFLLCMEERGIVTGYANTMGLRLWRLNPDYVESETEA